ncbi:hypothetical protein F4820DRAFT_407600 [Hypoxylon rubiginosum]|uniref:Uncharacterized protein n=1 Tax=Hypoxylon rubiginosum TaxID=110542 RepID=A0ACB9ZBN0_9PEZI|nr:hypothetical protein F4820DRAFT_407600 [Hypoxylon rubiginosum]
MQIPASLFTYFLPTMKTSILSIATVLAVGVTPILAKSCDAPWEWCGWDLLRWGNYQDTITQALSDAGQPTDDRHVEQSLFRCLDTDNGNIKFESFCSNGCSYGGTGDSDDYCS